MVVIFIFVNISFFVSCQTMGYHLKYFLVWTAPDTMFAGGVC